MGRVVDKVEAQMLMGQKLVRDVRSVVYVRIHAEGCRVHHDLERLHGVLVEVGVAVMESGFLTGHEKVLDRQLAKNIADRLCGTTGSQDKGATMMRAKDRSDGEFKSPCVRIEAVQFKFSVLESLDPDRIDRADPLGNIQQIGRAPGGAGIVTFKPTRSGLSRTIFFRS